MTPPSIEVRGSGAKDTLGVGEALAEARAGRRSIDTATPPEPRATSPVGGAGPSVQAPSSQRVAAVERASRAARTPLEPPQSTLEIERKAGPSLELPVGSKGGQVKGTFGEDLVNAYRPQQRPTLLPDSTRSGPGSPSQAREGGQEASGRSEGPGGAASSRSSGFRASPASLSRLATVGPLAAAPPGTRVSPVDRSVGTAIGRRETASRGPVLGPPSGGLGPTSAAGEVPSRGKGGGARLGDYTRLVRQREALRGTAAEALLRAEHYAGQAAQKHAEAEAKDAAYRANWDHKTPAERAKEPWNDPAVRRSGDAVGAEQAAQFAEAMRERSEGAAREAARDFQEAGVDLADQARRLDREAGSQWRERLAEQEARDATPASKYREYRDHLTADKAVERAHAQADREAMRSLPAQSPGDKAATLATMRAQHAARGAELDRQDQTQAYLEAKRDVRGLNAHERKALVDLKGGAATRERERERMARDASKVAKAAKRALPRAEAKLRSIEARIARTAGKGQTKLLKKLNRAKTAALRNLNQLRKVLHPPPSPRTDPVPAPPAPKGDEPKPSDEDLRKLAEENSGAGTLLEMLPPRAPLGPGVLLSMAGGGGGTPQSTLAHDGEAWRYVLVPPDAVAGVGAAAPVGEGKPEAGASGASSPGKSPDVPCPPKCCNVTCAAGYVCVCEKKTTPVPPPGAGGAGAGAPRGLDVETPQGPPPPPPPVLTPPDSPTATLPGIVADVEAPPDPSPVIQVAPSPTIVPPCKPSAQAIAEMKEHLARLRARIEEDGPRADAVRKGLRALRVGEQGAKPAAALYGNPLDLLDELWHMPTFGLLDSVLDALEREWGYTGKSRTQRARELLGLASELDQAIDEILAAAVSVQLRALLAILEKVLCADDYRRILALLEKLSEIASWPAERIKEGFEWVVIEVGADPKLADDLYHTLQLILKIYGAVALGRALKSVLKPSPPAEEALREALGRKRQFDPLDDGRKRTAPPPPPPPPPHDILMPGGRPIGVEGTNPKIRVVPGGDAEARGLFDQLTSGASPASRNYGGSQQMDLPGGGWVGLRQSQKFGTTLDIDIPGIPFNKVHFK